MSKNHSCSLVTDKGSSFFNLAESSDTDNAHGMRDYHFKHYTVNHSGTIDTCDGLIRWFKNPANPPGCQTTNEIESMFGQLKQWKGTNRKQMGKSQKLFRNWCSVWLIWKNLCPKDANGDMFTFLHVLHESIFRSMFSFYKFVHHIINLTDLQQTDTLAEEMDEKYEVDFIIDEKKNGEEYLVKWTRYAYYDSKWEPKGNITRDIIKKWQETDEKTRAQRIRAYKRSIKNKPKPILDEDSVETQTKFKNKIVPKFKQLYIRQFAGERIFKNGTQSVKNIIKCRRRKSRFIQTRVSFICITLF